MVPEPRPLRPPRAWEINPSLPLLRRARAGEAKPFWDMNKADFAPRFAIAYSPDAKGGFFMLCSVALVKPPSVLARACTTTTLVRVS